MRPRRSRDDSAGAADRARRERCARAIGHDVEVRARDHASDGRESGDGQPVVAGSDRIGLGDRGAWADPGRDGLAERHRERVADLHQPRDETVVGRRDTHRHRLGAVDGAGRGEGGEVAGGVADAEGVRGERDGEGADGGVGAPALLP